MRLRIHHPLFAGFVGVVTVLVATVLVLVGRGFRRELEESTRQSLVRELALAGAVAESFAGSPQDVARFVTTQIRSRASLISLDGRVVGDSDVRIDRLGGLPSQLDRPEVQAALGGMVYAGVDRTPEGPSMVAARRVLVAGKPLILRIVEPLADVDVAVARTRRIVVLAGLGGVVLALGVAYLLSRALTQPLVVLSDRARGLASGDFSRRAPRNVQVAELDDLGSAFNRLTDELRARLSELSRERDEMQALIDGMAEGVIALTEDARILRTNRAARALLHLPSAAWFAPVGALVRHPELRDVLEGSVVQSFRAREISLGEKSLIVSARMLDKGGSVVTFLDVTEIRRLEQVRRDFVANASHELKTPLTTIRGFAETLLEDDPPDHLRKEFLTSIRDNTLRLQRMVEDLLDLSRLESGAWSAHREEIPVEEIAEQAWEDFEERARTLAIRFTLDGSGIATADEQGLRQIFRNLFENSLRYTPKGGAIAVRIEPEPGRLRVQVRDSGAGIPSKSLPRIFERFYRADSARARSEGGTGLGLAIVRHLVVAMGGEVGAESELGQGTTIWFTLPVDPENRT